MNELVKIITKQDGKQAVSARELYEFLETKTDFTDWCKRMFEYGFEEDKDFTPILGKTTSPKGGRPSMDYALTIDCAKEISMLQRTDKGKQARQYFIEMEKKAINIQAIEPEELMLRQVQMLIEQKKRLLAVENDVKMLKAQTQTMPDVYTAAGFLTIKGVKATLLMCQRVGMSAARICKQNNWSIGKCPDPRFGMVGVYPVEALELAYVSV